MKSEARQDRPTFDIFLKKKGKWSIVHSLRGNFSNLDLGPKFPKRRRCTQNSHSQYLLACLIESIKGLNFKFLQDDELYHSNCVITVVEFHRDAAEI